MAKKKRYSNGYLRTSFTYNSKRYYVYGRTAEELLNNETKKRQELEQGINELKNPTLSNYYEYFTQIRRNEVKEATIRAQQCQFKVISSVELVKDIPFGNMRIKDITKQDIENARAILFNSGSSAENLNICFAHLNHVFNNAVNDETILKNPCKALKPLKRTTQTVSETKHRALTQEETIKFFTAAVDKNSFYLPAFKMMISSGLRIGELAALFSSDIDIKNGFIHVNKTITRDEAGGYYIGRTTKTEKGKRDIPLNQDLIKIVMEQENINKAFFGISFVNTPIFKSSEGYLMREYTINREIKRICKAAGIEEFTCHAFRNTFATRFIEQRPHDYKILSEILGHSDIKITLNLYTHVMTENKVNAMNDINIKIS